MNLNSNDYRSMICARADWIRNALYPQTGYGVPQPVDAQPQDAPPDFDRLKLLLDEISELTAAFETSIGPA